MAQVCPHASSGSQRPSKHRPHAAASGESPPSPGASPFAPAATTAPGSRGATGTTALSGKPGLIISRHKAAPPAAAQHSSSARSSAPPPTHGRLVWHHPPRRGSVGPVAFLSPRDSLWLLPGVPTGPRTCWSGGVSTSPRAGAPLRVWGCLNLLRMLSTGPRRGQIGHPCVCRVGAPA